MEPLEGRLMLSAAATGAIDDLTIVRNAAPTIIDLADKFDDPAVTGTLVRFQTDVGSYVLHLFNTAAPITTTNFLNYVNDDDYIDSFFHRTAPIGSTEIAIVQGGGFTIDGFTLDVVPTDAPIVNEFSASRPNVRGTIAMAKTSNPDSATSQFFINTIDNPALDSTTNSGGFTVFGEVYQGMSVVDAIAALPRFNINEIFGLSPTGGPLGEVPLRNIQGNQLDGEANFVVMRDASTVDELAFTVSSDNTSVVTASIVNGDVRLAYVADAIGVANITVTATDVLGNTVQQVFEVNVEQPNEPPVANDDSLTITPEMAAVINVLANDTDSDGTIVPGTVTIVDGPAVGSLEINAETGAVTFTPPTAEFLGTVSFTYTVDDEDGATSNIATASITIDTQLPPVGNDDAAVTIPGQAVDIDVLANDFDPEEGIDPTTVTIVDIPDHGSVQVNAETGVVTYTPAVGFVGTDTFTYIFADDAAAVSQEATVTVVTHLPPVGNPDTASTAPGQAVDIDVLANDTDAEDGIDPTSVAIVGSPASGSVQVNAETGVVTYTPAVGFVGTETFTYVFADDQGALSQETTVTVITGLTVTIDGDTIKSVTYVDADGTQVTVDVKGGTADLLFDAPASATLVNNKGKVVIEGSAAELLKLEVTQGDDSTQIKVKTKGGADGLATFGDILSSTNVKQIQAKTVNVAGDVIIAGSLEKLELNNVAAGGQISIGAGDGSKELQIKLNTATATMLSSAIGIKQIQAESWVGMGDSVGNITAPWLSQLKINDDLQTNMTLTNGVAGLDDVLGKVQVKDQIIAGNWQFAGNAGAVQADSITGDFSVTADGEFGGIKTKGDAVGTIVADFVGSMNVGGAGEFTITADGLKDLKVKSDLMDTTITLGGAFDASVKALGKLDVKGMVSGLTLNSVNSLGKIGATAIANSHIFAGIGTLEAQEPLPNDSGDYAHMAKIDGITIKGKKDGTADYAQTNIATWEIGKVKLSVVEGENADLPFGVGASIIGGIDGEVRGGDKFKFSKLDDPQAFMDELTASGVDLNDFRIELF